MGKVKLYDLNMNEIKLRGVKWLELSVEAPSSGRTTDSVQNGEIVLDRKRNSRFINARFMYESADFIDYKLLRNELYRKLDPIKQSYIVDGTVAGMRWKVEMDSFNIERINQTTAEVAVVFYCPRGLAESIGTTLDPFTYQASLWGYGMGLKADASAQDYKHSTNSFSIFNAGDEEIDPCESELLITIKSTSATASTITLKNTTNGSEWKYTGSFNAGDTITLDRLRMRRNGLNIVQNTNLELIRLNKGNNNFTVSGLSGSFEITFKFRYLYL